MPTILLTLSGPLQAWGVTEGGSRRDTSIVPSLSGVIGLVASSLGRDRSDPLTDLYALDFAVRADLYGSMIVDFHTIQRFSAYTVRTPIPEMVFNGQGPSRESDSAGATMQRRGYLCDAVFVVALSGEFSVLEDIAHAVAHPAAPLYLGRRCCPAEPLSPVIVGEDDPLSALKAFPYQGESPIRRNYTNASGEQITRVRNGTWGTPEFLDVYHTSDTGDLVSDVHLARDGWYREFSSRRRGVTRIPFPVGREKSTDPVGLP